MHEEEMGMIDLPSSLFGASPSAARPGRSRILATIAVLLCCGLFITISYSSTTVATMKKFMTGHRAWSAPTRKQVASFAVQDKVIVISKGDITAWEGDAIVNAANAKMLGGGGVDGAIHRVSGPRLVAACRQFQANQAGHRCPTGEARMTPGFSLKAKFVIHTVGPVYSSPQRSAPLLHAAYMNSMELAAVNGLKSIAFPAISCGVYGYPVPDAARIALETTSEILLQDNSVEYVEFVLFSHDIVRAWMKSAESLGWAPREQPAPSSPPTSTSDLPNPVISAPVSRGEQCSSARSSESTAATSTSAAAPSTSRQQPVVIHLDDSD